MKKILIIFAVVFVFAACEDTITDGITSKIKLQSSDIVLWVGETFEVNYTLNPKKENMDVNWLTSNIEVATVSKGIITALSPGVTDIIAETKEGDFDIIKVKVIITDRDNPEKLIGKWKCYKLEMNKNGQVLDEEGIKEELFSAYEDYQLEPLVEVTRDNYYFEFNIRGELMIHFRFKGKIYETFGYIEEDEEYNYSAHFDMDDFLVPGFNSALFKDLYIEMVGEDKDKVKMSLPYDDEINLIYYFDIIKKLCNHNHL